MHALMLKCSCRFCGGKIEYDHSREGEWLECPHCQYQTRLLPCHAPLITQTTLPPRSPPHHPKEIDVPVDRRRSIRIFCAAAALLAAVVFFIGCLSPSDPSENRALHARFGYSDKFLIVRNESHHDWPTLAVYLNGEPPSAFKYSLPGLAAGQSVSISLKNFVSDGRQSFQDSKAAIRQITISGPGFDTQTFQPD